MWSRVIPKNSKSSLPVQVHRGILWNPSQNLPSFIQTSALWFRRPVYSMRTASVIVGMVSIGPDVSFRALGGGSCFQLAGIYVRPGNLRTQLPNSRLSLWRHSLSGLLLAKDTLVVTLRGPQGLMGSASATRPSARSRRHSRRCRSCHRSSERTRAFVGRRASVWPDTDGPSPICFSNGPWGPGRMALR